jgi:hypothetical protein
MKRILLSLALVLIPETAFADDATAAPLTSPVPQDVVFDVYRNGSEFGQHSVRFSRTPDGALTVEIDIALRAGLGPITVFRYEHASQEVWRAGELVSFSSETLRDGDTLTVDLDAPRAGALPLSSHWQGYEPDWETVLNTETGEPMPVEIVDMGRDWVETASGALIEARHVRMTGTLTVDLWYDASGRWVGCAFSARGQDIRYILRDEA